MKVWEGTWYQVLPSENTISLFRGWGLSSVDCAFAGCTFAGKQLMPLWSVVHLGHVSVALNQYHFGTYCSLADATNWLNNSHYSSSNVAMSLYSFRHTYVKQEVHWVLQITLYHNYIFITCTT